MGRFTFAFVFFLVVVLAAWYTIQYERDDPAGRAMLESWAGGVTASTSSETAGYSCELSAAIEEGTFWVLTLDSRARTGAEPNPEKKPVRFQVEVNEHFDSVAADLDGSFVIRIPLDAFRLNQRSNDVRMLLVSQDETEFGGWAFGNITFDEAGVGIAEPSWFEKLTN